MPKKKLEDTKDKLGNPIEIWQSDTLQYTPTVPTFLKVYAELIEKNYALESFSFKITNKVVWIQDSAGNVMAGIAYDFYQDTKVGWIVLSFTEPKYRGRGLNQICHNYFESECKKAGMVYLSSLVSVDNQSRIKSAAKVGLVPKWYRMYKPL